MRRRWLRQMSLVRNSWPGRSMVLRRSGRLISVSCESRHFYDNSPRPSSKAWYGVRLRPGPSPVDRLCDILDRVLDDDLATVSSFWGLGKRDGFAATPRNNLGDISAMRRLDYNSSRLAFVRRDRVGSSSASGPGSSLGNILKLIARSLYDDGAWPFAVSGRHSHRLGRSAGPRHGGRDALWVPSWDLHNLGSRAPARRRNCDRLSRRAIPRLCSGHAVSFWDGNSRSHVSRGS